LSFKRYLILLGVIVFGALGDCFLSRGMKELGSISLSNWHMAFHIFGNPWVVSGVLCLLCYFASYLTSLSWADLTYVLPASAVGYILIALMARFFLQEQVSFVRWLGILLIVAGVCFVATGSHVTPREKESAAEEPVEVRG